MFGKAIEQAPSMKRTVKMHLLEHHGWTCAIMNACRLWADGGNEAHNHFNQSYRTYEYGQLPKDTFKIIRRSPNIREGRASTPECECVSKLTGVFEARKAKLKCKE